MKTLFSLKTLTLLFAIATAFTFTACDKDDQVEPIKDKLVGTWDITSYKVGGEEYMGFIVDEASIEFQAYTGTDGQFVEEVTFPDEETSVITGAYTVDDEESKVYMEYDTDLVIAKITFSDEDHLTWDGTQDGFPLVIKATRK